MPRVLNLCCAILALVAYGAIAGEGTNQAAPDAKRPPASPAAEAVRVAGDLASWGRANDNAAALALAAKILGTAECKKLENVDAKTKGPEAPEPPKKEAKDVTPETLLAEAKALAGGNEADQGLVESISKIAIKARSGAEGGPISLTDWVAPHSTWWITRTFRGGEYAWIRLQGQGVTDLDIYVYDENNNPIVSGIGYTDREFVSWTPAWTGSFRIEVRNLGNLWNRLFLWSN